MLLTNVLGIVTRILYGNFTHLKVATIIKGATRYGDGVLKNG